MMASVPVLYDLHCHLDFAENPRAAAARLEEESVGCLSVTVTPDGYEQTARELRDCGNVRVGLGLHPWWIADGACGETAVERFGALLDSASFVGEVGLDFSPRHEATRTAQVLTFERIAAACAARGGKVLSIHAVRAAGQVLDILADSGCAQGNVCVFHWFSGSSDDLQRAINMGCYFSVGERMLATKRGRAYARAIPSARLVLETDMPAEPGAPLDAADLKRSLQRVLLELAQLRGIPHDELADRIAEASCGLLGW